jgi:hypothetical protein
LASDCCGTLTGSSAQQPPAEQVLAWPSLVLVSTNPVQPIPAAIITARSFVIIAEISSSSRVWRRERATNATATALPSSNCNRLEELTPQFVMDVQQIGAV